MESKFAVAAGACAWLRAPWSWSVLVAAKGWTEQPNALRLVRRRRLWSWAGATRERAHCPRGTAATWGQGRVPTSARAWWEEKLCLPQAMASYEATIPHGATARGLDTRPMHHSSPYIRTTYVRCWATVSVNDHPRQRQRQAPRGRRRAEKHTSHFSALPEAGCQPAAPSPCSCCRPGRLQCAFAVQAEVLTRMRLWLSTIAC
jgi:hypothetical protein